MGTKMTLNTRPTRSLILPQIAPRNSNRGNFFQSVSLGRQEAEVNLEDYDSDYSDCISMDSFEMERIEYEYYNGGIYSFPDIDIY